eukprot:753659-Hanusia_phi.AAC.1
MHGLLKLLWSSHPRSTRKSHNQSRGTGVTTGLLLSSSNPAHVSVRYATSPPRRIPSNSPYTWRTTRGTIKFLTALQPCTGPLHVVDTS